MNKFCGLLLFNLVKVVFVQEMPRFVAQLTIFRVFFQVVVKLVEGDVACKFDGIGLHQILKRGLVNT